MVGRNARRADCRHAAPEDELALLLVGTRLRREANTARLARLAATVDQDALANVLIEQRVLPLAGGRLVQLAPAVVTESFRRRVEAALKHARLRAFGFSALTCRVVQSLEGAGIRAVPLKGPTLAAELHGDEALREYADIDVLVARADLDRSAAVLRDLGWSHDEGGHVEPPWLHRIMRHPGALLPEVELHWRIHWYETQFAVGLLERARVITGLRRLDRLDQLAALLLFYARDGFTGLRFPADIAAWWDLYGSPAVPADLRRMMAQHPALAEPWRAALAAALRVAGLPGELALPEYLPQARRSEYAVRLTNWNHHGETDQIQANVYLIDGLLAPRGALHDHVSRWVFPPLGALSSAYPIHSASRFRAGGYRALHAGKLLARYGWALWRLRGGRSWSPPAAVQSPAEGLPPSSGWAPIHP
jgi:hypothetical protein